MRHAYRLDLDCVGRKYPKMRYHATTYATVAAPPRHGAGRDDPVQAGEIVWVPGNQFRKTPAPASACQRNKLTRLPACRLPPAQTVPGQINVPPLKARMTNVGRGERIRTSDSCVPNAVLYQAELHPDRGYRPERPTVRYRSRSTAKASKCSKESLQS